MQVLQSEVAAALLKVPLQGDCCLPDLGGLPVVLDGIIEDEEHVLEELVQGLVAAALCTALHGPEVHGCVHNIKVVWVLCTEIQYCYAGAFTYICLV